MKSPNTLVDYPPARFRSISVKPILIVLGLLLFSANGTRSTQGVSPARSTQEVQIEGELEVLYEDFHPGSRLLYFLHADGKKLALHFARNAPQTIRTGTRVSVRGLKSGKLSN